MRLFNCKSLVALGAIAVLMPACKPSEQSYKEAYEKTISAKNQAESEYLDEAAIAAMQRKGRPMKMVVDGDTLNYQIDFVVPVNNKGEYMGDLKPFYIILGRYKQVFNANEQFNRVKASGLQDATILKTADSYYLAALSAGENEKAALQLLKTVEAKHNLGLKVGYPYVLRPANFR